MGIDKSLNLLYNYGMTILDLKAHKEGQETSIKYNSDVALAQNPYPPKTDAWYSWNQGWNSDNQYPRPHPQTPSDNNSGGENGQAHH